MVCWVKNNDMSDLDKSPGTVRILKKRKIWWTQHVNMMRGTSNTKRV
jgi:hypothetical protein